MEDPEDRLREIRYMFHSFLKRCQQFYIPGEALSLDEAIKNSNVSLLFSHWLSVECCFLPWQGL
jgi:hypothetical protein